MEMKTKMLIRLRIKFTPLTGLKEKNILIVINGSDSGNGLVI